MINREKDREETLESVIERLRRQGSDDGEVEAKACAGGLSASIWDSVSAFANTNGGLLILGLSESDGFMPADGFRIDEVIAQFMSGCSQSNPEAAKVSPIPPFDLKRDEYKGKPLLLIKIPELAQEMKPCYVKSKGLIGGSFKRIDDRDERLSSVEVYELKNTMIPSPADRELVDEAAIEDLNPALVERLLESQKNSKALRSAETTALKLARLNVLTKNGDVRLGGLLALGEYPQQFFPKLLIDVTAHPGTEKSEPGAPRFLDRVLCEGYVGEAVDEAVGATLKNLRTYSYVVGTTRKDEPEIPIEVLREAIVNAVVHREYSMAFRGQSVSVDIFPDRVEITSPGGLWGGKTLENLDDGQSRCRNDALMKLLSILPAGEGRGAFSEGQGSGIGLMIREMKSRALGAPKFKSKIDSFTVVLLRGGAELSENTQWIESHFDRELSSFERSILSVLRKDGSATVHAVREELGIDSDEIRQILDRFAVDGAIRKDAQGVYSIIPGAADRGLQSIEERIVAQLSSLRPKGIREVAESIGMSAQSLRPHMARLVRSGAVVPTAPPTSKNRKYLVSGQTVGGNREE